MEATLLVSLGVHGHAWGASHAAMPRHTHLYPTPAVPAGERYMHNLWCYCAPTAWSWLVRFSTVPVAALGDLGIPKPASQHDGKSLVNHALFPRRRFTIVTSVTTIVFVSRALAPCTTRPYWIRCLLLCFLLLHTNSLFPLTFL